MTALLQLKGVQTHIGAYHILHGVDFEVPAGQVTMLLGRNGAGKTTTLRTIMGLWAASQGSVKFDGAQIGGPGGQSLTPDIVQRGIAYVPENMGIFADLSVAENMLLAARNARTLDRLDTVAARMAVRPVPGTEEVLALSRRQACRAARSRCSRSLARWSSRGACLLIDEPSKGLAPSIVQNLIAALARTQAHRHDRAAGRTELRDGEGARRLCRGDGRRPRRAPRRDGRTRR